MRQITKADICDWKLYAGERNPPDGDYVSVALLREVLKANERFRITVREKLDTSYISDKIDKGNYLSAIHILDAWCKLDSEAFVGVLDKEGK